MNSPHPLVSAIVPAYNAETTICATINSILNQTYQNLEVIVVDDGSSDRTADLVREIALQDSRVFLYQQPNSGVAKARNLAIAKARGEYIAPIDADDIWFPEKIERQVATFIGSDRSVGLVYTWSVMFDDADEIKNFYAAVNSFDFLNVASIEGRVYLPLIYRNFVGNASVPLIRRSCLQEVGCYNELLQEKNAQGCEDWDLQLRIAKVYQFKVVPKFLVGYRQTTNSMSNNHLKMARSYHLIMLDIQADTIAVPSVIYRWSKSYFYHYLYNKSCLDRRYLISLYLLMTIIRIDVAVVLKIAVDKIMGLLLIISAKQFEDLDNDNGKDLSTEDYLQDIESKIYRSPDLKFNSPYQKLMRYRWHKTVELELLTKKQSPVVHSDRQIEDKSILKKLYPTVRRFAVRKIF